MTAIRTILIVDDEEIVRELLADMLSDTDMQAVTAESGLVALDMYRKPEAHFDLVVVDMSMPGMDGPAVSREIRKLNPSQKIIIATGSYGTDAELAELKKIGIADIMRKPFTMEEMLSVFERVMSEEGRCQA